jgi:hypothetical protein
MRHEPAENLYKALKAAQAASTLTRIQLGAYLCQYRDDEDLWRGKSSATTFRKFIIEEGFEPRAAQLYMEIAQRFVYDLGVSQRMLQSIASCGMTLLRQAARCADKANIDEICAILTTLPKPEARLALEEIAEANNKPSRKEAAERTARPVSRILDSVESLTMEQRTELMIKLGMIRDANRPVSARAPSRPRPIL